MAEVWSFNTTIRNPERMEALLRILSEMEGVNFDSAGQTRFFGLQIKKRFYTPTRNILGEDLSRAVYDSDQNDDLTDEVVSAILERYSGSVDSAGRGRTPAGVLNRFGLSIALQSHGPVVITPLGKKWIEGKIDDEELFTKFLLKWQYPNPIESGYSQFDIKPFPAVLHLIKGVNSRWERLGNDPVGLSKEEYRLYALSLKQPDDIDTAIQSIIEYRQQTRELSGRQRTEFISNYARSRTIEIFGYVNENSLRKNLDNLKAYMDSSLRYFRVTGLVIERGAGRYVDISEDKKAEVDRVITSVNLRSTDFATAEDYLNYIGDLTYELPWENETDLQNISENLSNVLESESLEASVAVDTADLEGQTLSRQVGLLKDKINSVRIEKLRSLRHDLGVLDEAIDSLSKLSNPRYSPITARPSLDFEWYASRALMVLNDAIRIEPSFKVGDDGLPTGFRGNISDIECEYTSFGMTVEVTLLTGRDQWYAEGQPVMRHLRDFEEKLRDDKKAFCIFVAPYVHRDTLNQFWTSNKYEFEGKPQRIIPLTIGEFVELLRIARGKIESNDLDQSSLSDLLCSVSDSVGSYSDSKQWQGNIKELVASW